MHINISFIFAVSVFCGFSCLPEWHAAVDVFLCSVGANPFDEEDDEEDFSNVVGIPVEALYDYVGQEDDEMSFKKGITVQNLMVKFLCLHYLVCV